MDNNDTPLSRRGMVGAAAAGAGMIAAAAAQPAAAQTPAAPPAAASAPAAAQAAAPRPDPRSRFPRPPFQEQTQPFPGLAGRMDPRPDHGETSYRGSGRLAGRKALITGGDSGMGRAAAISYLPDEEPDAREVIDLIRREGRIALAIPGDIRDEAHCRQMVATAVQGLGGLDIVVNNASRQQQRGSLEEITSEDFDATMKTNVYAMFWITKAALPHLTPGAAIIQTTSEQAYDPSANLVDYALTKAAEMNFTKSLAKQLGPKGIRVNGVAPGPIWTPLQVSGGATMEKLKVFGGDTPLGRPGQPAELASIYVQLAAADASYATGQIYGAAGGSGQP